jgi:hypothetical protein
MMRTICLVLLLSAGCARQGPVESQPPQRPVVADSVVAVPTVESEAALNPATDFGVRVLERAVAPDTPALEPIERFGVAPRPQIAMVRVLDPSLTPRVNHLPPTPLPAGIVAMRPAPPAERVPPDLGAGASAVPAKPKLPVPAVSTKRSRDVNLPPPLSTLGRPMGDRVGFEDPTTDFGNAGIARPPVKVPYAPASFVKLGIPNPFELAEQIKPTVSPPDQPGLAPVPVNPRRVK